MPTTYRLVVHAKDTAQAAGRLEAVDPNNATGIAIPAFRTVTANPPTANQIGEAILNTTTGLSYVWDGLAWKSIVPPSLVAYANDTAVLADTTATAGTYGFSQSTGNLWVRFDRGGGNLVWRPVGCRVYPTQNGLLGDAAAAEGTMGLAVDTRSYFVRAGGTWIPSSWKSDTAANIQAIPSVNGQLAFSTDTHKLFFADGVGGWDQLPWTEYATEAALTAATPPDGTMAVALDTGHIAYRVAGAWKIINSTAIAVSIGETAPAGAVNGQLWYKPSTALFQLRESGAWKEVGGGAVKTGAEPAAGLRKAGLLWYDGSRLWIYDAAGVWVEV